VLVVTSKHNVHTSSAATASFSSDHFDAIGISRYLPVLIYQRGSGRAVYLGHGMENTSSSLASSGCGSSRRCPGPSAPCAPRFKHLRQLGPETADRRGARVPGRLTPKSTLKSEMPKAQLVEALMPLERLRHADTAELNLLSKPPTASSKFRCSPSSRARARRDQARAHRCAPVEEVSAV